MLIGTNQKAAVFLLDERSTEFGFGAEMSRSAISSWIGVLCWMCEFDDLAELFTESVLKSHFSVGGSRSSQRDGLGSGVFRRL